MSVYAYIDALFESHNLKRKCTVCFILFYIGVDPCLKAKCEQKCTNTSQGSFRCSCAIGYKLESNGFNCSSKWKIIPPLNDSVLRSNRDIMLGPS